MRIADRWKRNSALWLGIIVFLAGSIVCGGLIVRHGQVGLGLAIAVAIPLGFFCGYIFWRTWACEWADRFFGGFFHPLEYIEVAPEKLGAISAAVKRGEYDEALERLNQLLEKHPHDRELTKMLVEITADELGDHAAGRQILLGYLRRGDRDYNLDGPLVSAYIDCCQELELWDEAVEFLEHELPKVGGPAGKSLRRRYEAVSGREPPPLPPQSHGIPPGAKRWIAVFIILYISLAIVLVLEIANNILALTAIILVGVGLLVWRVFGWSFANQVTSEIFFPNLKGGKANPRLAALKAKVADEDYRGAVEFGRAVLDEFPGHRPTVEILTRVLIDNLSDYGEAYGLLSAYLDYKKTCDDEDADLLLDFVDICQEIGCPERAVAILRRECRKKYSKANKRGLNDRLMALDGGDD